jgi:hypothetical protein
VAIADGLPVYTVNSDDFAGIEALHVVAIRIHRPLDGRDLPMDASRFGGVAALGREALEADGGAIPDGRFSAFDADEGSAARFTVLTRCTSGLEALECWVEVWTDYLPRIHPVARALLAARTTEADAAQAWTDRATTLRRSTRRVTQWLHDDGVLARHLTVDTATDLMWALASVPIWEALTEERHWSAERYRRELTTALERILVDELASPSQSDTLVPRARHGEPPSAR